MITTKAKAFFFDRKAVLDKISKASARSLGKLGGKIRLTAQRSMRYRKSGKASPAGSPPFAHKDGKRGALLRQLLFYSFDPSRLSVVIGPVGVSSKFGSNTVPHVQEFGGTLTRMVRKPGPKAKAGRRASPAQAAAFKRKVKSGQILLKREAKIRKVMTFPARPYMGPALKATIGPASSTLSVWKDSVRAA